MEPVQFRCPNTDRENELQVPCCSSEAKWCVRVPVRKELALTCSPGGPRRCPEKIASTSRPSRVVTATAPASEQQPLASGCRWPRAAVRPTLLNDRTLCIAAVDHPNPTIIGSPPPRSIGRDHVDVRVAEVDRAGEAVLRDAAGLDAFGPSLGEHLLQRRALDLPRDVQVEVVMGLELERRLGCLEEGDDRAVVEPAEGVQRVLRVAAPGLRDLRRAGQRRAEEALVEGTRLFGADAPRYFTRRAMPSAFSTYFS